MENIFPNSRVKTSCSHKNRKNETNTLNSLNLPNSPMKKKSKQKSPMIDFQLI